MSSRKKVSRTASKYNVGTVCVSTNTHKHTHIYMHTCTPSREHGYWILAALVMLYVLPTLTRSSICEDFGFGPGKRKL